MSDLSKIIQSYSRFERKVQAAVKASCEPYCSICRDGCCKPDACRETIESPFLSLLYRAYPPRVQYSETDGWLTESGCALTVGRAPVCYEFLCDRIIHAITDPTRLYTLKVLSRLITHTGWFAPGRRHVVELMQLKELQQLKLSRFQKRLAESENAFAVIRAFQAKKPLTENGAAALSVILRPPKLSAVPDDVSIL